MTKRIPIVDKNDTIITHKNRSELDAGSDIIRSASVWITNSSGDVLLARRQLDKRVDPGKWAEAVGGTVEGNESYQETAYREAAEELGIRDAVLVTGPKQLIATPYSHYFVQWYYLKLDRPAESFVLQESEVEQVKWWNVEKLKQAIKDNPDMYIHGLGSMIRLLSRTPLGPT